MCETALMWNGIDINKVYIRWNGWKACVGDLVEHGWEIEHRTRWRNQGRYIYLRNERLGMLGRLSFARQPDPLTLYCELDFLTSAKAFAKRHSKRPYFSKWDTGFKRDDIGDLLTLISSLQADYVQPTTAPMVAPLKQVA